ncbi:unnamed protein product [Diplocarpon coronariae]|nr:hypothetical protein JHW43_004152 [Diplocarpon mali]
METPPASSDQLSADPQDFESNVQPTIFPTLLDKPEQLVDSRAEHKPENTTPARPSARDQAKPERCKSKVETTQPPKSLLLIQSKPSTVKCPRCNAPDFVGSCPRCSYNGGIGL